jgi:glyoxylase-like metal-dependent hydrolase (beta-lactamase superfamily II)
MTQPTRRAVLAGATAATALAPLMAVPPARAAAPLSGKQAPGFYRYKVGSHEVTVVTDGFNAFPMPDNFVTNVKRDDVNNALAAAYMEKDKLTIPYSPIVVNTGSKLVAIDTGTGEANFERSKGAGGQYHANLRASGIDRNSVDIVLISHFHADHINGLITPDNKPAFANA